ncbi:MAG TPA: trypsin-like peptidase domain-containing protein [Methanobacterium sp.]|nr:trypsin-like peptidase domain-containing protein [Methanobacterium sp.]
MLCSKCGFKNPKNTSYCIKCNKKLKNNKKSRNNILFLFKVLLLIIAVAGISGMASAYPLTEHSAYPTQTGNAPNETVYIENGFSGTVTIKDTQRNVITFTNVDYKASGSGSGLIVTPNGYIITAFHVVSDPIALDRNQTMRKIENRDTKWYVEREALKDYINKNPQLGYKLLKNRPKSIRRDLKSDENIDYLTKIFIKNNWISAGSYQYTIYVKGLALNRNHENPLKARIVDIGNYKSDEDIALLKIDPKVKNLPVFTINSKYQEINENLRIYGYPGDNIETLENKSLHKNESIASSSIYTPSYVSGLLTAKTPNPQGIMYYQTNAITTGGYSGGPIVDNDNRVLGILIYGLYDENKFKKDAPNKGTKKEINDGSLFLPSNYIIKICKKNKIPINVF